MGNDPSQDTLWSIPGSGVLARQGSLVLLTSIDDHSFAESLLDLLARVSKDGGDGRALADAIGAQTEEHHSWGGSEAGPAIVSFGPAGDGMAVSVFGSACADLSTAHGAVRLTADHPSMLLKSTVGTPVQSVRAALDRDDSSNETDRFSRLDSGTVRAGGLSYYSAPSAAATPGEPGAESTGPREAWPVPEQAGQVVARYEPGPGKPDAQESSSSPSTLVGMVLPAPEPSPEPGYAPVGAQPNAGSPVVLGIYCEYGHFTDPDAQSCVTCGTWIRERPAPPEPGPRPPLGVLILDNGAALAVDGDYVIGREPAQDPSVASGTARPLRIADAKSTISRVHARVHLEGWRVLLTDLGAANGTHVQTPDAQMPLLLEPQVPVPIRPGTRIFVGAPCLKYERSHDGNHVENGL